MKSDILSVARNQNFSASTIEHLLFLDFVMNSMIELEELLSERTES